MGIYEEQERVVITEEEEIDTLSETRAKDIITEDSAIIAERTVILRDLSFNTSNVVYEENSAIFDGIFTYTDEKGTEKTSDGAISLSLGSSDEVILYDDNQVLKAKLSKEIKARIPLRYVEEVITQKTTENTNGSLNFESVHKDNNSRFKTKLEFDKNDIEVGETTLHHDDAVSTYVVPIKIQPSIARVSETANTLELTIDSTTYIVTAKLKNKNGAVLSTQTIDLPLEEMIINVRYDKTTKEIVLTLKSGETTRISVADLVSGLVSTTEFNQYKQQAESEIQRVDNRIDDLELYKFPNVTIVGNPTINNGQISGFTNADYLQFPNIIDVNNQPFEIEFEFTTGNDVITQQNVIDSYFGIALAIRNGRGLMEISGNGSSWDLGSAIGDLMIMPNTTYRARLTWDTFDYRTYLSTDGQPFVVDMRIRNTSTQPYPRTIFIGGSYGLFGEGTDHRWKGSINLNMASLTIGGITVWYGMDDVGLSSRADRNLGNITEDGKQVIKDNAGVVVDIGSAQFIEAGGVFPSISVEDCKKIFLNHQKAIYQVLDWTLYGTHNYLVVVSTDVVSGTYFIDVLVHNEYHIAYSWTESQTGYANHNIIKGGSGTTVKINGEAQNEVSFTSDPQTQLNNKVPTTRTVNGKDLSNNISLTASDVGASTFSGDYNDLSNKPTIPDSYTKAEILNVIYPVGSIYLSVNNVDPSTFIGGTWTKVINNADLMYGGIRSDNYNFELTGQTTGAKINLRSGESKSAGSAGNLNMYVQSGETNSWETFRYTGGLTTNTLRVYAWKRTA